MPGWAVVLAAVLQWPMVVVGPAVAVAVVVEAAAEVTGPWRVEQVEFELELGLELMLGYKQTDGLQAYVGNGAVRCSTMPLPPRSKFPCSRQYQSPKKKKKTNDTLA